MKQFISLGVPSGEGYLRDYTPLTRDQAISDFYKNALPSLTPDAGTTPIINSYGAGTQPVIQFVSGGKRYSLAPAIGTNYTPSGAYSDDQGNLVSPTSYQIDPNMFGNWSNNQHWTSKVDGLPVMQADWAKDLVDSSIYKTTGGEYTGGGWLSESPIATNSFQSAPEDSWMSQFMQGPAIPLFAFLGAGALGAASGSLGGVSGAMDAAGAMGAAGGAGGAAAGAGSMLYPGEAVIGNAWSPYGGSLWQTIANNIPNFPTSPLFKLLQSASGGNQAAGANNMSVFDVLSGDDAALGQGMLNNGWTVDNPTVSIPGYGDVYGSWDNIIKNLPGISGVSSSLINRLVSGSGGSGAGLLGGLLGALAGGMGANQRPAGTTTSVQDIPDYLKPYQAMNLSSGVNNFAAAGQGASMLPGAQAQLQKTINGDYLNPNTNPAFQPYVKDLMGQAGSQFASLYGKSPDNLNNSGFQESYTRAITNAVLPLYNSAYQTERGNQINAASNAPAFASNYAGAALAPNLAFKNLYTGAQANTQPYFTNPMGGALSGGLAGYTLGNSIFGGK